MPSNLIYFLVFFGGTLIGSFLNVIIWRLPREEKITGRSHCVHCGHKLSAWELIPILSFIFLLGRCRDCRKKISWRYPLIELIAGFLTLYAFWHQQAYDFSSYLILLRRLLIIYTLLAVFVVDLEHFLILDKIIFPPIFALLAVNLFLDIHSLRPFLSPYNRFLPGLWSAGLAALPFFLLWRFSKGRWMGFGDVKLALFLGVAFGWPLIVVNLLLGIFAGGLVAIILLLFGKKTFGDKVALGTFLSLAGIVTVFYGNFLWFWYLSLIRV